MIGHGSRSKPRKQKTEKLGVYYSADPLASIDREELKSAFASIGKKRGEEFPTLVDDAIIKLGNIYPPYALAVLSTHGLSTTVSDRYGTASASMLPQIEQHTIEILQALVLTIPQSEWYYGRAEPAALQALVDTLPLLTKAFAERRYGDHAGDDNPARKAIKSMQETLRLHTQVVRNWGYFDQVVRVSKEVYAGLDEALLGQLGFSVSQLIDVAHAIKLRRERLHNEWFRKMRRVAREHNINRVIRAYHKEFPRSGSFEELKNLFTPSSTREHVMSTLLANSEIYLLEHCDVKPEHLSNDTNISTSQIRLILENLSNAPGDLASRPTEFFFLDNPVWSSPGIILDGSYFFPAPHTIFSHMHSIVRGLASKAGLSKNFETERARYLERKLITLVNKAIPKAICRPNLKWSQNGRNYENDLVIIFDQVLLIFEAKSASLTPQGLRGAPDRVKRHVQDLVIDPSIQSLRLEKLVKAAQQGEESALSTLISIGIDPSRISEVVRISITIDDFSMIAALVSDLKQAGWAPDDLDLAPSISAANFEIIVDILHQPLLFIHYLAERKRLQASIDLIGDELDLLGLYLETGFNIAGIEQRKYNVFISGMSRAIDLYYDSLDAGVKLRKPKPKICEYFFSTIDMLAARRRDHWTTIGLSILRSADPQEQKQLERMIAKLRMSVPKTFRDPCHDCSVVMVPPRLRDTAVAFYVFRFADRDSRKQRMQNIADQIFSEHDVKRVVIIARMIEDWQTPYQSAGIFYRAQ